MASGTSMMALGITIGLVDQFSGKAAGVLESVEKMGDKIRAVSAVMASTGASLTGFGLGARNTIVGLASSFSTLEDASTRLKVAMMDSDGMTAGFEELDALATSLGDRLPGATSDFQNAARALMEQGVAIQSVLGGGLEAAASLGVVMNMPAEAAAEMTAKLREAYKLSDSELPRMADSMQRAKFAFGVKPGDLLAANAYMAPMLNQLGISGI